MARHIMTRGPIPKDPAIRQRTNRASTAAKLKLTGEDDTRKTPPLPKHKEWAPLTRAWWRRVWRSPMAAEYLEADLDGLYRLLELIERFWRKPSTSLAAEIRTESASYGLTPIDRRRLQWEVERLEKKKPAQPRWTGTGDPRDVLRAIK